MFSSIDLINYTENKIYQYVSSIKRKSSNKLNFRCPICGDSLQSQRKMRGWFNYRSGTYKCYNGGCPARKTLSGLKFLALLQNKSIDEVKKDIIQENSKHYSKSELLQKLLESNTNPSANNSSITPILSSINTSILKPITWVDISNNKYVEEYLNSRKIYKAPYIPNNWKLYYESEKNKIVIPWIRDKQIVYYQYRSLYKDDLVKYYFPPNLSKDIFGLDLIDDNFKYIFLIEGVFDSIFVKNGIAIGGTELSDYQSQLLDKYKLTHKFVWLFDNQWKDNTSYIKSLELLKKNDLIFIWPKNISEKDVNDFYLKNNENNSFTNENFLTSNIYSGGKGLLKLKFKI